MNARTRLLVALARRIPHPEPPTAAYLARMRLDPPGPVARAVIGPLPRGVRARTFRLPEPIGLRARLYRHPPGRSASRRASAGSGLPLVINFHGGGFVIGSLLSADWLCGQVAAGTGAVVVSVAYRLAPEHPAPIPYTDCWGATQWLLGHAERLGADPARAAVMGASAGGNLAALVALGHRDRCRADPRTPPLRAQVLIYPATDLTLSSPSVTELADAPMLNRSILDWYGRRYLPQDVDEPIGYDDPRVSPLFAEDHRDVAPALLIAAGLDPLRDDAFRYGQALRRAGVPARTVVYPHAIHGFVSMPRLDPAARSAVAEIVETLREALPRRDQGRGGSGRDQTAQRLR